MIEPETMLLRLLLSVVLGGAIGFEREYGSKAAGFRTLILISMGSCLFTMFSLMIDKNSTDRIASNIVTGIGFLGAGVILRRRGELQGITTAATIWITASLGMGAGGGFYWISIVGTVLAVITLIVLTRLERWIDEKHKSVQYKIVINARNHTLDYYEDIFKKHKLQFKRQLMRRTMKEIECTWLVRGSGKNHHEFVEEIIKDETVYEFES